VSLRKGGVSFKLLFKLCLKACDFLGLLLDMGLNEGYDLFKVLGLFSLRRQELFEKRPQGSYWLVLKHAYHLFQVPDRVRYSL